jgi:hypothetical protein
MLRYQSAVFAALGVLAVAGPVGAQPNAPLPKNNPEAMANVRQSQQYSAALRSNPAFRKKREALECGPITDPQLHASCIASFENPPPAPNLRQAPPSETVR